ncbi:hypothetical protein AAZX31_19G082900 [Glycine max]|uniref:Pectinesterase inhibitor n=1 Tax=Glycine soja TaxID=3848 RepID=A0A0B2RZA5_GLYSO|nr:hypothetical protein JHK86_052943 [Glycine max]KAG4915464.1 hypothetical protein JHK87_053021 [Glycine soja]KAG4927316.1 hypothetical protein JHK85_053802 [Glycine max]KAG5082933.1 hypothetical protein JHK84_052971 [Glycine max]KAG5085700.1 hypothetical protein JHK82_053097 [Glycine max]
MVHSFIKHPLLPSLLLLLCSVFSLCSARTVKIRDICSKHPKPDICGKILLSLPGAAEAVDLRSASLYVINVAHGNATEGKFQTTRIARGAGDPETRQRYNACSKDYTDVLLSLARAKKSYSSGNYSDLKSNGAIVIKDVQDCDTKATDSTYVLLINQDVVDTSRIIVILADYLAGKY